MLDIAAIRRNRGQGTFVTGSVVESASVIETYKSNWNKQNKQLVLSSNLQTFKNPTLDISWLEAAAETYNISGDPRDYVLVEVPLITLDCPNRNCQAFPFEEMSYFDPLHGKMVFQTFLGKPTHQDHDNKDPLKAKGVNFDVTLQYVQHYDIWKCVVLSGFDRTKDKWLADQIATGKRKYYSMGALVDLFLCSICGNIDTQKKQCSDMKKGKGSLVNGAIVYQLCVGVNFIENSSVTDPADITAAGLQLWK